MFQCILKKYKHANVIDEIREIAEDKNIPKLIESYYMLEDIKDKELVLNIIWQITSCNRPVSLVNRRNLEKFLKKEIYEKELLASKIDLVARHEFNSLGKNLLDILQKNSSILEVGELDTLLYALGRIGYKPARNDIEKYINSEHETVRNCAKEALDNLNK